MTTPFTLVSATDVVSGPSRRAFYTVPAGKQAFIKSVIAANKNTNTGTTVTLELLDNSSNYVQLSRPSLAASASSNTLPGTLVMQAGESLVQSSPLNYFVPGDVVYDPTGTALGTATLSDIIFANNLFVAIGTATGGSPYNNFVVTSPDGIAWTWRDVDTATTNAVVLKSIAFGAGLFVVVGNSGFISTSPDGVTWTTRTSASAVSLNHVIFANNQFVAVGGSTSSNSIQTSPDGITWTGRTGSTATVTASSAFVTYDTTIGLYAMSTGQAGNAGGIQTSPDGITWTQQTLPNNALVKSVISRSGKFIAIPSTASAMSLSTDGLNWSAGPNVLASALFSKLVNNLIVITYSGFYQVFDTDEKNTTYTTASNASILFVYNGVDYLAALGPQMSQTNIYKSNSPSVSRASDWTASIIEVQA